MITAIESDPPEPALADLVGSHNQRGFRARMDEAVPEHREAATVLHQLLDDVPMAALINGYGWTRELGDDFDLPAESSDRLRDRCAGWINDGVMLGALDETGIFPIPLGPDAPDLDDPDDPLAWHEMEPMVPRSVRRRRRLDLVDGDPLIVDVHFRDSHLAVDAAEDILHEYTLQATVDPTTLVVLALRGAGPHAALARVPQRPRQRHPHRRRAHRRTSAPRSMPTSAAPPPARTSTTSSVASRG